MAMVVCMAVKLPLTESSLNFESTSNVDEINNTYYTSQREIWRDIFHEPKASEISRHISQLMSVIP